MLRIIPYFHIFRISTIFFSVNLNNVLSYRLMVCTLSISLPDDVRFRPPIGNGHVATNVLSDTVYMNAVFNGRGEYSSRARIPGYVSLDINTTLEQTSRRFSLDMYNGE